MRIPFRQGIVTVPPGFLQQTGSAVSLVIATPIYAQVAFADGSANYLLTERVSVSNAWSGPFVPGTDYWLYWDINVRTGVRTFGHTLLEPIESFVAPLSPQPDQHWFDTSTNVMKVWNSTALAWHRKIRVFAAKLDNGSILVSVGINSPIYEGTQVGALELVPCNPGALVFDVNGDPIKHSNGTFFTTEDVVVTGIANAAQVKLGSILVEAVATANIPAYSAVHFTDFHQVTLTTNNFEDEGVYGVIEVDAVPGDIVNVVLSGVVSNPLWNWTAAGVNAPVYADALGYLTTTAPPNPFVIGTVVDQNTIIIQPTLRVVSGGGGGGGGESLWELAPHSPRPLPETMATALILLRDCDSNALFPDVDALAVDLLLLPPGTYTIEITVNGTPFQVTRPDTFFEIVSDYVQAINNDALLGPLVFASTHLESGFSGIRVIGRSSAVTSIVITDDVVNDPLMRSVNATSESICFYDVLPPTPYEAGAPVFLNALTPKVQVPPVEELFIPHQTYIDSNPIPANPVQFWTARTPHATAGRNLHHGGIDVGQIIPGFGERVVVTGGTFDNPLKGEYAGYIDVRHAATPLGGTTIPSFGPSGRIGLQYADNDGLLPAKVVDVKLGAGLINVMSWSTRVGGYGNEYRVHFQSFTPEFNVAADLTFWGEPSVPSSAPIATTGSMAINKTTGRIALGYATRGNGGSFQHGVEVAMINQDGSLLWQHNSYDPLEGAYAYSTVAIDINETNNNVYVGVGEIDGFNEAPYIACLNGTTGNKVWEFELGATGIEITRITDVAFNQVSQLVYVSGMYYDSSAGDVLRSFVLALNAASGAQVWFRRIDAAQRPLNATYTPHSSVKITTDGANVYVAISVINPLPDDPASLWVGSLNGLTGNLIWQREIGRTTALETTPAFDALVVRNEQDEDTEGDLAVDATTLYISYTTYLAKSLFLDLSNAELVTIAVDKLGPAFLSNADLFDVIEGDAVVDIPSTPQVVYTASAFFVRNGTPTQTGNRAFTLYDADPLLDPDIVEPFGSNVTPPTISTEIVNIGKIGQLLLGDLLPPPASLRGSITDLAGMLRADAEAIYYCFADHGDIEGNIWKKLPFDTSTPLLTYPGSTGSTPAHANGVVRIDSATPASYTIEPDSIFNVPVGTAIVVKQVGIGQVSFVAGSGVILRTPETLNISKQYGTATLIKAAPDVWELDGNLELI